MAKLSTQAGPQPWSAQHHWLQAFWKLDWQQLNKWNENWIAIGGNAMEQTRCKMTTSKWKEISMLQHLVIIISIYSFICNWKHPGQNKNTLFKKQLWKWSCHFILSSTEPSAAHWQHVSLWNEPSSFFKILSLVLQVRISFLTETWHHGSKAQTHLHHITTLHKHVTQ